MTIRKFESHNIIISASFLLIFLAGAMSVLDAKDTDIYEVSVKQNCYILQDNSASMDFGVYEHTIDYYEMFKYLFRLYESAAPYNTYIYDTINNSDHFYYNSETRNKIYLLKGNIGVTTATVDGQTVAFTGDAADPNYIWYTGDLVDTNVLIDSDGNLTYDGSGTQRVTVDGDGYILLDGARLPLNQDIKLHDMQTLYDGTQVDTGFGGLLNAPGYYFSGYEGVTAGSLDTAESGDTNIYFFITGNWINMQAMYNLHYKTNNPVPTGASTGDMAWKYEVFPLPESSWPVISYPIQYPDSGDYPNNMTEENSMKTITHPGAEEIQLHFTAFDVQDDNNVNQFKKDYVAVYDGAGTLVAQYDNDNPPTSGDGWTVNISDDTVKIALYSNNATSGTGYAIDQIRVSYYSGGGYLMQNRLDIAKDAILYVVDTFHGKMNWGYASYQYLGTSASGATDQFSTEPQPDRRPESGGYPKPCGE